MWLSDGLFIFIWVSFAVAITETLLKKFDKKKEPVKGA